MSRDEPRAYRADMGQMGKSSKAESIEEHAERARHEGRAVFVPLFMSAKASKNGPMSCWAEMPKAV